MRVAIGVATFNRGDLVSMSARSLSRSRLPPDTDIVVVDDASTGFGVEFLKEVFLPGGHRRPTTAKTTVEVRTTRCVIS